MPTMFVRWRSILDRHNTCPTCHHLHGYEWRVPVAAAGFPDILSHHAYGAAWDMAADHSLIHPPMSGDCRCHLEYEFQADDIQRDVDQLRKQVEQVMQAVKP